MQPTLLRISFFAFIARAYRDGVRVPALAYQLGDTIVVYAGAASVSRLAHEYHHYLYPDAAHEPWYTFDVFSYNPIRLWDKHGAVAASAAWRAQEQQ